MVIVRWGTLVSAYALEVALSMHDMAVLVSGIVGIQVNWPAAHRTSKFFLAITVLFAMVGPLWFRGKKVYYICAVAYSRMPNRKQGIVGPRPHPALPSITANPVCAAASILASF